TTLGADPASRDVADGGGVRERPELLQALVLDLADPLARHVERAADLVERPRLPAVEAVAQLEHLALPRRERAEDRAQRLATHRDLGRLVGKRLGLIGEEVTELRLLLVADRLLERDRCLRAPLDLLHLLHRKVEVDGDLERRGLARELGTELALRAADLVELFDD